MVDGMSDEGSRPARLLVVQRGNVYPSSAGVTTMACVGS
jgi:hypothetical protein